MGWIDELIEAEFASGKDPPKDPPEELNKNPVLSNVLRENKAEGKFIKEYTDKIIRYSWSDRAVRENICYNINSECPIDLAFTWRNTKQGHEYWRKLMIS